MLIFKNLLRPLPLFGLFCFLSLCLFQCSQKPAPHPAKTPPPPFQAKPLGIPHLPQWPELSKEWLLFLQTKDFPFPKTGFAQTKLSKKMRIMPPAEHFNQTGQILHITLTPPSRSRLSDRLKGIAPLENIAEAMQNLRPDGEWPLQLQTASLLKNLDREIPSTKLKSFFYIKSHASNSALGADLCKEVEKWASAAQLLEGRTQSLSASSTLFCRVSLFLAPLPAEPFLDVGQLSLPIALKNSSQPLFQDVSDLHSKSKLKVLSPASFAP